MNTDTRTESAAEPLKVLAFDVFGTVVDWHGGVVRAIQALGLPLDGDAFARDWRAGYQPALARVNSGQRPWARFDDLHLQMLDDLLIRHGVLDLSDEKKRELNAVWEQLDPWPDAVEGLTRLKERYTVCALSNGNLGLLFKMAQRAGLPWDTILSAESFGAYKPDPRIYKGAAHVCDVQPQQVLMVAAHQDDLNAARGCGLQTAYVERPLEYGPNCPNPDQPDPANTYRASSLIELATQLGC